MDEKKHNSAKVAGTFSQQLVKGQHCQILCLQNDRHARVAVCCPKGDEE